jgi:predicted nucleic acid-binding protein
MICAMPSGPTVTNSSCLIALEGAGELGLLEKLYGRVEVPSAVALEFGSSLPAWVDVLSVQDQALVQTLQLGLGPGESEAIALAKERSADRLVLDDRKARRIAQQLGLPVTGTLAILIRAKERGFIASVRDVINALLSLNFRLSDTLVEEALRQANE